MTTCCWVSCCLADIIACLTPLQSFQASVLTFWLDPTHGLFLWTFGQGGAEWAMDLRICQGSVDGGL